MDRGKDNLPGRKKFGSFYEFKLSDLKTNPIRNDMDGHRRCWSLSILGGQRVECVNNHNFLGIRIEVVKVIIKLDPSQKGLCFCPRFIADELRVLKAIFGIRNHIFKARDILATSRICRHCSRIAPQWSLCNIFNPAWTCGIY